METKPRGKARRRLHVFVVGCAGGREPVCGGAATTATPDKLFEKRWATTLLERVLAHLRQECRAGGKGETFEALKDSLWGEKTEVSYAELGARWGMTEGAVKGIAYRLRRRYRELLQAEIAQTVADPGEIEQEVRDLIAAVSG